MEGKHAKIKRLLRRLQRRYLGPRSSLLAVSTADNDRHPLDRRDLVVNLSAVRWRGNDLEIEGWAYVTGRPMSEVSHTRLSVVDQASGERVECECRRTGRQDANHVVPDNSNDLTEATFIGWVPGSALLRKGARWRVEVDLDFDGGVARRGFTDRRGCLPSAMLPAQEFDGEWIVRLVWTTNNGLRLVPIRIAAVLSSGGVAVSEQVLTVPITGCAVQGARPALVGERTALRGRIEYPDSGSARVVWDVSKLQRVARETRFVASVRSGFFSRRPIAWCRDQTDLAVAGEALVLFAGPTGALEVLMNDDTPGVLVGMELSPAGDSLKLTFIGPEPRPATTGLAGPRATSHGSCWAESGRSLIELPLTYQAWSGKTMPLPEGKYQLVWDGKPMKGLAVTQSMAQSVPQFLETRFGTVRCGFSSRGAFSVTVESPLGDTERGAYWQQRLRSLGNQPAAQVEPRSLYLDSWYGKSFSDNPAALYLHLRDHYDLVYVGVKDRSVEVPEGAIATLFGSSEWWNILVRAGTIVTNTFPPSPFERKSGQFILQTWHGTPLKLLGLDRPEREGNERSQRLFRRHSRIWDALVSPNPYSSEILSRAYAFEGAVLETGYPRNDVLVPGHARRNQVRKLLGFAEHERIVLYAPTWREDDKKSIGVLDCEGLAGVLGEAYRVLARGHSVTLRRGTNLQAGAVLDVTSYPDMADLLAACDVLITDYSSCMFDFSVTGRPIVFYVPDFDDYLERGRGGYFDLAREAPGPLTFTLDQLAEAIVRSSDGAGQGASAYESWKARFNPWDDGQASHRVADHVLANAPR